MAWPAGSRARATTGAAAVAECGPGTGFVPAAAGGCAGAGRGKREGVGRRWIDGVVTGLSRTTGGRGVLTRADDGVAAG
ncbi:hypothetical protein BU198_00545 [Streptomyces sp. CBMA156]|nr:hypothetical protein [Streptomyces sp. CBMA156]